MRSIIDELSDFDEWRDIGNPRALDASGNDDWGDMVEFNDCFEGGVKE